MDLLDNCHLDRAHVGCCAHCTERRGGIIKNIIMFVGVYTLGMCVVRIVLALTVDRSGNSGRYKHWEDEDD